MNEELIWKASFLEQQCGELQNNLEIIEKQILELGTFKLNIEFFSKSNETKMLSSVGKGVYVKTDLLDKKLFVEVGAGVIVKKTSAQIEKIITDQIQRLSEARGPLAARLKDYNQTLKDILSEIEKSKE